MCAAAMAHQIEFLRIIEPASILGTFPGFQEAEKLENVFGVAWMPEGVLGRVSRGESVIRDCYGKAGD